MLFRDCAPGRNSIHTAARKNTWTGKDGITDTALIREILGEEGLKEFVFRENDDRCMEIDEIPRKRVTDEEARKMIERELGSIMPGFPSGS